MFDFLDIILSVVIYLSPHDVKAIQVWPYAADANKQKAALMMTYRWQTNRWCQDFADCLNIADGQLLDEQGKVLLDIKDNLKVANQTNYTLFPKNWVNPLKFSWQQKDDERTISIYDSTNVTRQIRVKLWKSAPPIKD